MRKRIVSLVLALMLLLLTPLSADAYDRKEHNEDIEKVLFGTDHTKAAETLKALEYAVYLTLDQYNGHGGDELNYLRNTIGVQDLPTLEEINFTSSSDHRYYTHRGWNMEYTEQEEKKSHWTKRKSILKNTVQHLLFNTETPLSWFPWLSDKVYGKSENEEQIDSFSALLYYVHVLGDHIDAKGYKQLNRIAPLVRLNDKENPGIIPELEKHLAILFSGLNCQVKCNTES